MHRIAGELRNLKRRSKPIMTCLRFPGGHLQTNAERCANEWVEANAEEPEPVTLQLSKDGAQIETYLSCDLLNQLNERLNTDPRRAARITWRFRGFNGRGEPMYQWKARP